MSQIPVLAGTPLGDAVAKAQRAFRLGKVADGEKAYRAALELVPAVRPDLWAALAADHVAQLSASGRLTDARIRSSMYLEEALDRGLRTAGISLRLLRAEISSYVGDFLEAEEDLEAIRAERHPTDRALSPEETAVLLRLEGLVAAEQGRRREAEEHLDQAARIYQNENLDDGSDAVARDRTMIALWYGDEKATPRVIEAIGGPSPRTISERLLLAAALRSEQRYEDAIEVLGKAATPDLDPALLRVVARELAVLLGLTAATGAARRLLESAGMAARISAGAALHQARQLVADRRLDDAEALLVQLRTHCPTDRDAATWHLAAAELELELAKRKDLQLRDHVDQAIGHLRQVIDRTPTPPLVEIRICALRMLGSIFTERGDPRAEAAWAEVHHLEEGIVARQRTDEVRFRMLYALTDEHDERIRAAAAPLQRDRWEAAAAVVVAMEAARAPWTMSRILPGGLHGRDGRDLPAPNDHDGTWWWVRSFAEALPRTQVAWLLHSAPEAVYHALVGRGCLHYLSVPCPREALEGAVNDLIACWATPHDLEVSTDRGDFDRLLARVTELIGLEAVVRELPAGTDRIAVVAGGALAEVPVAAMTLPWGQGPIGLRYALSSLPCLSARAPLQQRSRHQRGDAQLLVRPPADGLTMAEPAQGTLVLKDRRATAAALDAALRSHEHPHVRIDSHGTYEPADPTRSSLRLAPDCLSGSDGRVEVHALQAMDLSACGTLVLGACESGMSKRIGREERVGFVRAAFLGGAASVIAARWAAEDRAAATVLDAFDRYVRYLPRDVALRYALLDVCNGAGAHSWAHGANGAGAHKEGSPAASPVHPSRWACWTLYGDAGYQTEAGLLRRALRRRIDERRGHGVSR